MGKRKQVIQITDDELSKKIDRLVEIRPQANEYSALCREIKTALLVRHGKQMATVAGNTAMIEQKPTCAWLVDKLQKVLSRNVFGLLCPRRPDKKKLDQRLAATPENKALAACRVDLGPGKPKLIVLAKGEELSASAESEEDEDEEEAAA